MAASVPKQSAPLVLVCGEDDFAVKQRAKQIYLQWTEELGGMDHEIIDASVSHSGEALKALAKLREAMQTLPFFGTGKVIWLQNCNFLSDERAATKDVTESLSALADELKEFAWQNVRLLISAGKVDKRSSDYSQASAVFSITCRTKESFGFLKCIRINTPGEYPSAMRNNNIVCSCQTGYTIKKDYNIFFCFHQSFSFFDNHISNLHVSFSRFIKSRTDNFPFNRTFHICNFFGTFIN